MKLHAFVAMPFGPKPRPDGTIIDFNRVYEDYLKPALEDAGLDVFRADEETRAGNIHADMFQELLIADLVVVDLTVDNPNVWYELGVRHALRARGVVLVQSKRDYEPFDIAPDRKLHYALKNGAPDPATLDADKAALAKMAKATLESPPERKTSPVFGLLPQLEEPAWKSLKAGGALEFWRRHEQWDARIKLAQQQGRVGDILLLADEAPVVAFRAEAAYGAAEALRKLEHFELALEQYEKCLKADPGHRDALCGRGICLQRLGKLTEARSHYQRLLGIHPNDPKVLAARGQANKDTWIEAWRSEEGDRVKIAALASVAKERTKKRFDRFRRFIKRDPKRDGEAGQESLKDSAQARTKAAYQEALLQAAIDDYSTAFELAPGDYAAGLNAATLMSLYQDLTRTDDYGDDIELMLGGVRWAVACELERQPGYAAMAALGALEILTGKPDTVEEAYRKAIAAAETRADIDWYALNATLAQLRLLNELSFRSHCVDAGIAALEHEIDRLRPPDRQQPPRRVLLFSGHRVDDPGRAGPRFPFGSVPQAEAAIANALDELGAGPEDLAFTQGASGGDLIFSAACQARGVRLRWLQPFAEAEFIRQSVASSVGDWVDRYHAAKGRLDPAHPPRCLPQALGESARDPYERCNLWLLYTVLAYGPEKVRFICLWNGQSGDGPGGTQHMMQEIEGRAGRVVWLDTRKLFAAA